MSDFEIIMVMLTIFLVRDALIGIIVALILKYIDAKKVDRTA